MKTKTIKVLVFRNPAGFTAVSGTCSASHPNSSTLAARATAALRLGVSEAALELTPIGPDVLEATIKRPAATVAWDLLAAVGLTAAGVAVVWGFWATGGAR